MTAIKKAMFFLMVFFIIFSVSASEHSFLRTPGPSPDGKQIVFSYHGDIWIVPSSGGTAHRLTAMDGEELYPRFSPDGKWIAFSSTQNGNSDIYAVPVSGGETRRLTFHDSSDTVDSWSWDSGYVYFTSERHNNFSAYKVGVKGGTPIRIFEGFFNTVHDVAEAPGSPVLYFTDTWESQTFATRKGYKGEYNPDIRSYNPETKELRSLTGYIGKDLWHSVDRNGKIYFASDEGTGEFNLFTFEGGKKTPLTTLNDSIKYPRVSADGSVVVFEYGYRLFVYDTAKKTVSGVEVRLFDNDKLDLRQSFDIAGKISYFDVSPDEKKLAFVSRGGLFVSDIEGKFIRKMDTHPLGRVVEVKWMSDSRTLLYNQAVSGYLDLFRMENGKEVRMTSESMNHRNIALNAKRDKAVYLRGKNEVRMMDLKTYHSETVAEDELWGFYNSTPRFSPDDRFIAFTAYRNFEQDILIHDLKNGNTLNLTDSGVTETDPFWSPDGKCLVFSADRVKPVFPRGGSAMKIFSFPLEKHAAEFRSDKWNDLFSDPPAGSKDKTEKKAETPKVPTVLIDMEHAPDRWERISPESGSQGSPAVFMEDGKRIVLYVSNHESEKYQLYKTVIAPFEKPKTEPVKGAETGETFVIHTGKKYMALIGDKIGTLDLKANIFTPLSMNHRFERDLRSEFTQMFYETWANLEINFYDENFHGADWQKMKAKYAAFLPYLTSRSDLRLLIKDMLGELNSSHLGFYSSGDEEKGHYRAVTSETGIMFDKRQPFVVDRILRNSPADRKGIDIAPGDVLAAVNGVNVDPAVNREYYFSFPSMDEEIELLFRRDGRDVKVKIHPVSNRELKNHLYDEWVDANQKRVDDRTGKRIAYVYMKDMGGSELERFLIDMTTEWYKREALILDLRYNRGGNVHDDVLNFLSQRAYSYWKYRGGKFAPQPNFAPSSKPIVLLLNEQSLSDAEMTGAGFKALKLGKIVGTETYRWLIFTSGKALVDGSFYRLPSWGCYTLDKQDLEITGVEPDIHVKNTLTDRLEGKDPQLDKAIDVILEQLERK